MEFRRNNQSIFQDYIDEWQGWADAGGYDHAVIGDWPRYAFQLNAQTPGNYVDKDFLYHNRTWCQAVLVDFLEDLYGAKEVKRE